mgnify:CR=1 FL=1
MIVEAQVLNTILVKYQFKWLILPMPKMFPFFPDLHFYLIVLTIYIHIPLTRPLDGLHFSWRVWHSYIFQICIYIEEPWWRFGYVMVIQHFWIMTMIKLHNHHIRNQIWRVWWMITHWMILAYDKAPSTQKLLISPSWRKSHDWIQNKFLDKMIYFQLK